MLGRISKLFYPSSCLLCGVAVNSGLCADCAGELPVNTCACVRCALPLYDSERDMCGRCLKKQPFFDAAWSPFIYAQPLEWMISQLKFGAKLLQANVLAELMMNRLPDLTGVPDCIMPVPLHKTRLRERGFNQSAELARPLARVLDVPLDVLSCRRLRATPSQTGMTASQRRRNLRGAFDFPNEQNYSHVVLFDDVMTTGATLNELAKLLKRQGVQRVEVWSLARAQRNNKKPD